MIECKYVVVVEKIIFDYSFVIGKEIKDCENVVWDYVRIIEDFEGDFVEMTDSRDVVVFDMMKFCFRLDEFEWGVKDKF